MNCEGQKATEAGRGWVGGATEKVIKMMMEIWERKDSRTETVTERKERQTWDLLSTDFCG